MRYCIITKGTYQESLDDLRGNTKTCLNDRFITGTSSRKKLAVVEIVILIFVALNVLYCAVPLPYIVKTVDEPANWILLAVFLLLFILTIVAFISASFTDPGFLPKNKDPPKDLYRRVRDGFPVQKIVWELGQQQKQQKSINFGKKQKHKVDQTIDIDVQVTDTLNNIDPNINSNSNNNDYLPNPETTPPTSSKLSFSTTNASTSKRHTLKYCETCKLYRPPRCRHCTECNVCVLRHDHHCPYLGTCVAQRNYRSFLAFIFLVPSLCFFTVTTAIYHIVDLAHVLGDDVAAAMKQSPQPAAVSLVFVILALPVGLVVLALATMHVYLIATGRTTAEACGASKVDKGDLTGFHYCFHVLFAHAPSSTIKSYSNYDYQLYQQQIGEFEGYDGVEDAIPDIEYQFRLETWSLIRSEGYLDHNIADGWLKRNIMHDTLRSMTWHEAKNAVEISKSAWNELMAVVEKRHQEWQILKGYEKQLNLNHNSSELASQGKSQPTPTPTPLTQVIIAG